MITVEPVTRENLNIRDEFICFCKNAYNMQHSPACANMWQQDWENRCETLPYLIYKSERFTKGNGVYFILRVDNNIEASSGIYISEFDKNVAIGGVRSWTNPGFKTNLIIGRHIFPEQIDWARQHNIKSIALTFNEYNKKLMHYFIRNGLGVVKNRTPNMMFYNGVYEVPFPVKIQNTKQWAIYHKIDEDYQPNWKLIEYSENL